MELISRQVLELWNRYKPTIAVDAIEYDRELKELLGTDLASLGTDCISRQEAIDAVQHAFDRETLLNSFVRKVAVDALKTMPSAQPEIVRCKDCKHWIPYDWMFSEVWQSQSINDYPEDEIGTDCISRQEAIDAARDWYEGLLCGSFKGLEKRLRALPSAQPERTCVNCGRTVNNGGWYADGGTRCPIEEHYALPKDGYCHLWEKRNVTDDDYPERRTDE